MNPRRIILTEDKDFGEWVFAHGVKDVNANATSSLKKPVVTEPKAERVLTL
jgi:hypothetical protein